MGPTVSRGHRCAALILGTLVAAACAPATSNPATLPSSPTAAVTDSFSRGSPAHPRPCAIPYGEPNPLDLGPTTAGTEGILGFLNAGGALSDLSARLNALGLAGGPETSSLVLDLNQDGWEDVVLALTGQSPNAGGPVMLLFCAGDHYVLAAPPVKGEDNSVPILHAGTDISGDGAADVLVGWRSCGAHTCQERLEVLSFMGTALGQHLLEPSTDMPFPGVTTLPDGSVSATATGIGSAGAGPFRRFTRTWAWDPTLQAFRLTSESLEPPRYRIHALLDADDAARRRSFQEALDLYLQVVLDDSLEDWIDPATEQANLSGYAMFRRVVTYVQMHDKGDAQKAYGILQNQYLAGGPGSAYARMAQAFWDRYIETNDPGKACQAAEDFATVHADEILVPLSFGYANPAYTSADVCPGTNP